MTSTDYSNEFLSSYKRAKSDPLNGAFEVKTSLGFNKIEDRVVVYTDGSAKGSDKAVDNSSFAGWGVYVKHAKGSNFREITKFGNLFNSSSFEAELRAVLEGLKAVGVPAHYELVTDCADVIEGFHKLNFMMRNYDRDIKRYDPINYPLLKLWKQIHDVCLSPRVKSLNVSWVRSHSLERYGDNIPDVSMFKDAAAKKLFENCVGNEKADKLAVLGALKSVRGALYHFKTPMDDEKKLRRSIETVRKNFSNSGFARDEAIRYISRMPEDYLPRSLLCQILDVTTLARIDQARKQLAGGADPDEIFRELLRTNHVISVNDPINKQMFMDKCRLSSDEKSLGG
jgi:ribonuclease HI